MRFFRNRFESVLRLSEKILLDFSRPKKWMTLTLLSLLPMFWMLDPRNGFYMDWFNHSWAISYFAAALSQQHSFPLTANTHQFVGDLFPIYYGILFYPLLAGFAVLMGASFAVRLLVFGTILAQLGLTYKVVRKLGGSAWLAGVSALSISWSIYSLSNLYNRSALTEFFATGFIAICLLCLWLSLLATNLKQRLFWLWIAILIGTLSAGFHPITLLAGAIFLAVALLWIFKDGTTIQGFFSPAVLATTALALLGCVMSLAGWLYVMSQTKSELAISDWTSHIDGYSFDKWWVRLTPFPFDSRMLHWKELSFEGTPHLDTQVSMPLILILIFLYRAYWTDLSREVKSSLKKWALVVAVLFWWSCNAENTTFIRQLLGPIQFTYRLVTYVNLGLLQFVLLALWLKKSATSEPVHLRRHGENRIATALVLFICFQLVFKLSNASRIIETNGRDFLGTPASKSEIFLELPFRFYGPYSYSMQKLYLPLELEAELKRIDFHPQAKPVFGEPTPLTVQVESAQWFQTNVLPHRWNTILVDGRPATAEEQRFLPKQKVTALYLPSGRHQLSYSFTPPPELKTWRDLQMPGLLVLCLGGLALGILVLMERNPRQGKT